MTEEYPKENIPDEANLFYRVHKQFIIDGQLIPGAFRSKVDGMSTDWDKYATADFSLSLSKIPEDNAILSFPVKKIRSEPFMEVEHDPIPTNRAHSLILGVPEKGELKTKVRATLMRIFEWEIKCKAN